MRNVIVTDPPRADLADVDALAGYGVATAHEAMGRTGLAGPHLRPIQSGVRVAGTAVTVLCWPGDNLMVHAAIEQCRPGDMLVVTTTSDCVDGLFGELFATAAQYRGVRGVVTSTGVRDVAELEQLNFPAWSAAVHAQGTVKATAGAVNVPITLGRAVVRPGDVIVADDDGVLCVPRLQAGRAVEASAARVAKEAATRAAFNEGQLGLDRYGLRPLLEQLGVEYVAAEDYAE
ncbi:4-carboxy-4-hydroxy-2-oxoadipate aldolase/oxaloacetate decarboxylase [Arthrobacter castelli]|uniref:4-carboxy-4-hydroxy-2-oxoadipate aldolase/oxaloacetate decarboxylase n=1 Tax=Arthrobacter castelli TaxID=271431 RepID=UPI00047C1227|nr:4-carboxy-4-hydroxy-2-oxoadipate aldolase/oxaloacetate decarboxylase [Arthrobacter castelli]